MELAVFGAGYVGLVTGVCLAELGHHVCCVDINQSRIDQLKQGIPPIFEENLEALLEKNIRNNHITFTTDINAAVKFAEIQMIAVGTPPKADGSADLQFVDAVATAIGQQMAEYKLVVNKSTVLMGTADRVKNIIQTELQKRSENITFDVASNPEFLKEGCAIEDFMKPDRIVVGTDSDKALQLLKKLYAPLTEKNYPLLAMKVRSAELTKYASNAFLAAKISFMNEMSRIAEIFGADVDDIKYGIGLDSRISEKFLNAGCGYGGSCFPKDVSALKMAAESKGYHAPILNATLKTNDDQQVYFFDKVKKYFDGNLKDKTIALWGLAFKPNTDDVRCAPAMTLIDLFSQAGANIQAFDPMAMPNVAKEFPEQTNLTLCKTKEDAVRSADVLLVVTEWEAFKHPDFNFLHETLIHNAIFDGRNLYSAEAVKEHQLDYFSIGRAPVMFKAVEVA